MAARIGHNRSMERGHEVEGIAGEEQQLLQRIERLVHFLGRGTPSLEAIMRHLLIDTFYGSSAFGHILHIVRDDGSLAMPAMSGFKTWPTSKFPERIVTLDTPLNRSLRIGEIVSCGSFEVFAFAGADYIDELFPNGFGSSVAWPVPGVGSVITFFSNAFDLTDRIRSFLRIVGSTIALSLKEPRNSPEINREDHPDHAISNFTLTARQWIILDSMRKGKTNPEIAQDLGFSPSLVRHETMKIFRQLAINGRKELLEMPDESFAMHLSD